MEFVITIKREVDEKGLENSMAGSEVSNHVSNQAGCEEISNESSNENSNESSNGNSIVSSIAGSEASSEVKRYKKLTGNLLEKMGLSAKEIMIVMYCSVPRTVEQIIAKAEVKDYPKNRTKYTSELVRIGVLQMTIPENPKDKNQKYVRVRELIS